MAVHIHRNDLPETAAFGSMAAVDTETMGLKPSRDRLCLVQLSAGDGDAHLVQFPDGNYAAPRLRALLNDPAITKLFHFARFDLAVLERYLGAAPRPVYCTRTASRLARTYTDRHGLKDLCKELLDIDLCKAQQSSDWGAAVLTGAQRHYAAADVLHLHRLKERLDSMLAREGRTELAAACFDFLPVRARLDLAGWEGEDIFAH